jgi:hypothetical protein|tara:strand:- start:587 stop:880 length:294 start_codon:yes stop_codon:yes gene_type:complete
MIDKLIKNQGSRSEACEKVLGSTADVSKIAKFWEKNASLVHLMATHELLEYIENNTFTKEESDAFKLGLCKVGEFMQKCWEETTRRMVKQNSPKDSK